MIYLVEDDSSIRELVIYALNSTGLEAKGFEKPSEFWKAVEEEEPSLVILDVMLPEESGIDVLKKIRSNPAIEKLPVIMETAKTSEYDRINGLGKRSDGKYRSFQKWRGAACRVYEDYSFNYYFSLR